jgi:serine/threonine protein phosphatase PrpC
MDEVSESRGADRAAPKAAAVTHVGRVRQHNEDSHGMLESLGLYVVCDGMGGANGGEVASQMAVEGFLAYIRSCVPTDAPFDRETRLRVMHEAVVHANSSVFQRGESDPALEGMGATLVAAWLFDGVALVANVGDSRAYLVHGNTLRQVTEDHSLLAEEVRKGSMTEEQAAASPLQSVITRALGTRQTVVADFFLVELAERDRLLLTSDGMLRHVDDPTIAEVTSQNPLQEACERLIELGLAGGGSDNMTCILVEAG